MNRVLACALGLMIAVMATAQEKMGPVAAHFRENASVAGSPQKSAPKKANLYLDELKRSLEKQTEFAVYQPNDETLWASVRQTVNNFLYNEWKRGALKGSRPPAAYYVKCDRTTMTQNDLNMGRLVVVVGVALQRPGEFVALRINQWTADHHK